MQKVAQNPTKRLFAANPDLPADARHPSSRLSLHHSRRFVTKPPRRQATRAREAVRRGNSPPGSFEEDAAPCRRGQGRLQSRDCDGRDAYLSVPRERGMSELRGQTLTVRLSTLRLLVA